MVNIDYFQHVAAFHFTKSFDITMTIDAETSSLSPDTVSRQTFSSFAPFSDKYQETSLSELIAESLSTRVISDIDFHIDFVIFHFIWQDVAFIT